MIVILAVIALAAIWFIVTYNGLVRSRNRVQEAWSGIDVQLKRRHDLLPKLVDAVKGYQQHERSTLLDVAGLREHLASGDISAVSASEYGVSNQVRELFALAERTPI